MGNFLNALKVNAFNFYNNPNIIPIVEMGKQAWSSGHTALHRGRTIS